ncbi:hypothetical protein [Halomicronema sp. CCY15110]|uniref:hypothetical protein n=1 Tax=Halomicronema sp. CCY15110 TaxID=2767773 RepID=UPI00195073E4|nr:hypothetical protein [Halomicronema sp. CCY15110]
MGEWSEYFEDFPEENPANYIGEQFNPEGARRLRAQKTELQAKLQKEQAALDAEIQAVIDKAKRNNQRKSR